MKPSCPGFALWKVFKLLLLFNLVINLLKFSIYS